MIHTRMLWQFVRDDAVARSLGLAMIFIAWFAVTWLSLGTASLLPFLGVALWWRYRATGGVQPYDDDADAY